MTVINRKEIRMNRLEKIEKDLEKAREKAAECQAKVRELENRNRRRKTARSCRRCAP